MKRYLAHIVIAIIAAVFLPLRAQVPSYDHVVIVILENHSYDEVANPTTPLPYINGVLRPGSANMTVAYGVQHPSQPNYYWIFSGSNQGILTDDPIQTQSGYPFATPNLYANLLAAGKSFGGFLDGYPGSGNLTPSSGEATVAGNIGSDTGNKDMLTYASRHVPWLGFGVPNAVSQPFTAFQAMGQAGDFSGLPKVTIVIPALENDMHDYATGQAVSDPTNSQIAMLHSDQWLQVNIDPYVRWAKTHNSLFILTTDEDSSADWGTPLSPQGLITPPADQITTFFAGANVLPGSYPETASNGINNVNVLRTVGAAVGLSPIGAQSPLATSAGLGNGPVTDIFTTSAPVIGSSPSVVGTVGQMFTYQIAASGSPTFYSATGLPSWASINTATGAISGIPTASGLFSVTLQAQNANGTGSATLTLAVNGATNPVTSGFGFSPPNYQQIPFNGVVYNQVLMTGSSVTVQSQSGTSGLPQFTRVSFLDVNNNIVQAEFGGPGQLTVSLAGVNASTPVAAVNYLQNILYVQGSATFTITGATSATYFSFFSAGKVNTNPAIISPTANLTGIATAQSLSIAGTGMAGVNLANALLSGSGGLVGVSAPGITIGQYVYLYNLNASYAGSPTLIFGLAPTVYIAGGNLAQTNGFTINSSGIGSIVSVNGQTSGGVVLPAQKITGSFSQTAPVPGPGY